MLKNFKNKDEKGVIILEPSKLNFRPLLRVILWGLLGLLIVGVGYAIFVDDESAARAVASEAVEKKLSEPKPFYESEAFKAFAVGFATEYLTVNGKDDPDAQRIETFTLGLEPVESTQRDEKVQEVEYVVFSGADLISEDTSEAKVLVALKQIRKELIDDAVETTEHYSKLNMIIPVTQLEDGAYAVLGEPAIYPVQKGMPIQGRDYSAFSYLNNAEKQPIKAALESFFRVYATGKPHEIGRYFIDKEERHGYEGAWQFKSITRLNAYEYDKGHVLVEVKSTWAEANLEYEFVQSHEILLVKDQASWNIEDMGSRLKSVEDKMEDNN